MVLDLRCASWMGVGEKRALLPAGQRCYRCARTCKARAGGAGRGQADSGLIRALSDAQDAALAALG